MGHISKVEQITRPKRGAIPPSKEDLEKAVPFVPEADKQELDTDAVPPDPNESDECEKTNRPKGSQQ